MLAGGAGVGCRGFSGSMYGMYEIMSGSTLFRQPRRPPVMKGLLSDQLIHGTHTDDSTYDPAHSIINYTIHSKLIHLTFLYHAHRSISNTPMASSWQITGGCLCGQVRYSIDFSADYPWPPAVSLRGGSFDFGHRRKDKEN